MISNPIIVEEYAPDILIMRWQANTQAEDVMGAFAELKYYLDQAQQSDVSVIVDISSNANSNLNQTLFAELDSYHHPKFREWLVLGKNDIGHPTQQENLKWFGSFDDLNQYLPCFANSQFVLELTKFNAKYNKR